jgi:hypothetical protein
VNFSGNGLDANQILGVLFDGNHVSDVNTDGGGSFSIQLVVPDAAPAGTHQVCVSESNGNLCSGFTVEAAPASTPTPSDTASPSPSPSPSDGTSAPAAPGSGGGSTLALLIKPPFVFLPIIAALGLLAFLGLYLWRARQAPPIGEVTILHRAPEPRDYGSLPEAPPPPPAPEPPPIVYECPAGPAPHPPPVPPPAPPSGADIPPDLPEASD